MSEAVDYTIIVAAGTGSRFGGALPKQFCLMNGRPLIMTTIDRFRALEPDTRIILVISCGMAGEWLRMCGRYGFRTDDLTVVFGGSSRTGSVRNALAAVDPESAGWISVHDGARPVISDGLLRRIRRSRTSAPDGVIPVVAETDSLRELMADGSVAVDRSRYVRVQTPQSFPAGKLIEAYRLAALSGGSFTDDASVMEAAGMGRFALSEGDTANIKVTHPGDIELAELFLSRLGE